MIDLQQYEVWFVTGSQHLYGPETLETVAQHSRAIADALDASPQVRHKLSSAGDHDGAAIMDIILRDEIGHVALGNYWYRWVCEQRGLDPEATYFELATQYRAPQLKGPLNMDARREAGFTEAELDALNTARN